MIKNLPKVFKAWREGKPLNGGNISTDGKSIFSYTTEIVSPNGVLNETKYSRTTSIQQSALRELLKTK